MKIIRKIPRETFLAQSLGYGDLFEDSDGKIYMICQSGPGQIMLLEWSERDHSADHFNRVWDPVSIHWSELNTRSILEIFTGLKGPIEKLKYNLTLEILNAD